MKGIILAGGSGTRLYPITHGVCKQLIPIYDKPTVYYPLSTLMLAGIRDILVITTPHDSEAFNRLLGDGSQWGIQLTYAVQPKPAGLADAFRVGKEFVGGEKVSLVLGDNVFYGNEMGASLKRCTDPDGGIVFAYPVSDPERYGVVEFDADMNAVSIEEKPAEPKSNFAVTGLYFYDNDVIDMAATLQPGKRGEYEITDINAIYLERGKLRVEVMDRGSAWLDTGTFASMMDASNFVQILEDRTGLKLGCVEEIAWREGFINDEQLEALAQPLLKSGYGDYLKSLLG